MSQPESLVYNSQRSKMIIPEYGRNVQNMINFACTVEDRDERNKIAKAIISVMGQLAPHLRDIDDFNHKLWAHLFIMSEFKLDVDSPYPKPSPESFMSAPERLNYPTNNVKYGHYGKTVERLIDAAIEYEDGEEKDFLVLRIANLMKRSYAQWNQNSVKDEVILSDLKNLSKGKLELKNPDLLESTQEILKTLGGNTNNKRHQNKKKNNKNRNNKKR